MCAQFVARTVASGSSGHYAACRAASIEDQNVIHAGDDVDDPGYRGSGGDTVEMVQLAQFCANGLPNVVAAAEAALEREETPDLTPL